MPDVKNYKTPQAFKQGLEQRLASHAKESNRTIAALRKRVCFERLLARLFIRNENSWAVKGGYRLELALERARTTKDIDLVLSEPGLASASKSQQAESMLALLQDTAKIETDDFLEFEISFKEIIQNATIGGARFSVKVVLAGKEFDTFRLDVILAETENARYVPLPAQNWLEFAGVAPPMIYALCEEMQFAEKLHAYTYPWEKMENTRAKDLVDMLMLSRRLKPEDLVAPIREIFAVRSKQEVPETLTPPPSSWQSTYQEYAREYEYNGSLEDCFKEVSIFYGEVLKAKSAEASTKITKKENEKMTTKLSNQFDVHSMINGLVHTNAFPQLKDKSLTECVEIAVKALQTANTAQSNQWNALLQALLTGAIVEKLDQLTGK